MPPVISNISTVRLVALVNGAGDFPNWGNLLVQYSETFKAKVME